MDAAKPHFLWNPSLRGRVLFYGILAALAVLVFWVYTAVFALILLGMPVVICGAAFYLFFYLPLLDAPLVAWRRTGNALLAVPAFIAALALPYGVPMLINAWQMNQAMALHELRYAPAVPTVPLAPRDILVVGEGSFQDAAQCGDVCKALLWSGAVDHVLAVPRMDNHVHLQSATRFTAQRMDACPVPHGGFIAPRPRDGWCLVGSPVDMPAYDAIIDDGYHNHLKKTFLPFGEREHVDAQIAHYTVYDCRTDCRQFAEFTSFTSERLSVPVTLHLEGNIDQGGPFGVFFAREPVAIHPLDDVLRTAFGLRTDVFAPRAEGTAPATPEHGNTPLTPDPRDGMVRRRFHTGPDAADRYMRQVDDELALYREKLHRVRAAHPECASMMIAPGPEPAFLGCSR